MFSVSFLNIGKRILSSSGTFMIFGGEVEASSLPARRFVEKAISDFIYLECKVFLYTWVVSMLMWDLSYVS